MRKITSGPVLVFSLLFGLAFSLGLISTEASVGQLPFGAERGMSWIATAVVFSYLYVVAACRLYLLRFPLPEGSIGEGSAEEFHYHVYLLFYLIFFQPLTRSLLLPVPLMRLVYIALGARLGQNTYSAGTILDPPLTEIGSNTIIGHDALLFSHIVEGNALSLARVRIGNNVTIGAKAVIMPGVSIADGAIIGIGAVVPKFTAVGAGQVWVGNPARMLRNR